MNTPLVLAAPGVPAPSMATALGAMPRPTLGQCVVLALLLHLWLVVLVGTADQAPSVTGEGTPPALRIRLEGPGPVDSAGRAPQLPPEAGAPGRAPDPRFGGAAPDAPARPHPEPGAAELGPWQPRPVPSPLPRTADAPATTLPAPEARSLPQLQRESEAGPRPAAVAPEPARPADAEALRPTAEPTGSGLSTAPRLSPRPRVEAPVLQRPAEATDDIRHSARTAAPLQPAQPAPAPQREAPPPAPPPADARDIARPPPRPAETGAPAAEAPAVVPVPDPPPTPAPPPVAAVPPPEPPPLATVAPLPPPPVPVDATPTPAPAAAAPPREIPRFELPLAPARPEPTLVRPATPLDLPAAPAPALRLPPVRVPDAVPPAALTVPPPPGRPASAAAAAPGGPASGATARAVPPAAAASAPLRLDLPGARSPGMAPQPRLLNLTPPPLHKSPLAEGIEKAGKADCRKAYAGMGLLGVIPLAADAVRGEGGCRW